MQAGPADRCAGQLDRVQVRHRRQRALLADLQFDLLQPGQALLGRELVRHHPARELAGHAQPATLVQVIDLDDHAVRFIGQVVAACGPAVDVVDHLLDVVERLDVRIDRKTELALEVQRFQVRLNADSLDRAQGVGEQTQAALGAQARIEQLERPGRQVARVGVEVLALGRPFAVDAGQLAALHVDLAAHLE